MELVLISVSSVLVQGTTVVLALRLVRVSGARTAWFLISAAIFGMAARRCITLFQLFTGMPAHPLDLPFEVIGLVTSLFMLAGIFFVSPIFESIRSRKAAIRKSEMLYRKIIETSQEGVWIIDLEGRVQFVNRRLADLLGYSPEEMTDCSIADFISCEENSRMQEVMEQFLQGKRERYDGLCFRRKDGSRLWGIVSVSPISVGDGDHVGSLGMFTDISERKLMEKERERMILELQEALANVKTLSGLLPICASCKKIRDDKGYWNRIEEYIRDRTEAEFSHSICPDCRKKLYPGY